MHRLAAALALVAWAPVQGQGSTDPMATAECTAARQQLEQVLAAGGPRDRLDAARRQAALTCLGRPSPPAPQGRFVPPPVTVAPIAVPAAPSRPAVAAAPLPAPPVVIQRAPVITACDAAGCWDSDGKRHNQQGPLLVGPRGLCTLQGGLLNCP
jgi:hypothetical protein